MKPGAFGDPCVATRAELRGLTATRQPRVGQLNQALAGRQWFHPKDTPWREMIAQKAAENAAMRDWTRVRAAPYRERPFTLVRKKRAV